MVHKEDLKPFTIILLQGSFTIWHNLPEDLPGWSVEEALEGWANVTKCFTPLSFINYIDDRQSTYTAFTQEQYNRLDYE